LPEHAPSVNSSTCGIEAEFAESFFIGPRIARISCAFRPQARALRPAMCRPRCDRDSAGGEIGLEPRQLP
jgi:hypothetical protein